MKHMFFTLLLAFPFFAPPAKGQISEKEWMFVQQEKSIERRIKQGQNITVKWKGISRTITSKGKLMDITQDSLKLQMQELNTSIAKHDIIELRMKTKSSLLGKMFAILLISLGLVVVFVGLVLWLVFKYFEDKNEEIVPRSLSFGSGMLVLGLLVLLLSTQNPRFHEPFGGNWWVQEIPTKAIKIP